MFIDKLNPKPLIGNGFSVFLQILIIYLTIFESVVGGDTDHGGKTGLEKELDGTASMSEKQVEFLNVIEGVISSKAVTTIETVSSDAGVDVGSITDNKIDMADIAEFDKAGKGAASSAGALSHELKEQQLKAEAGG